MAANTLVSLLVFLTGPVLLLFAVLVYRSRRRELSAWRRTEGKVVELLPLRQSGRYTVSRKDGRLALDPVYSHRMVVRFRTDSAEQVTFHANLSTRPAAAALGERVPVLYDPEDPRRALVNRPLNLWFAPAMLAFFGFFALGMGVVGLWLGG